MQPSLVIGSRGSKLALWQAEQAQTRLLEQNPSLAVRIEIIKTTGDVKRDPLSIIGGKGVFTKELEDALLERRIDLAVHSLKDLPTILPERLTIAAICEREDPRDALVLRESVSIDSLTDLASQAVVGTSSQRRLAQLKSMRPDVVVKELRGNVDTRLRKLDEGQYDALILAAAGLRRLGMESRISYAISPQEMLPAVGQGAIALETRSDDEFAIEAVRNLDHAETRVACCAERAYLRSLGGGCQFPIAAHAVVAGDALHLDGLVASPNGSRIIRDRVSGSPAQPEELGTSLAAKLRARGAESLLTQLVQ
ncbi:MAG TPA: hydroxymethylbilane synthase [Pyrinomonadaceae bacterium]|jgi:hydroxymethylbilane synthase|nr:hydroxymethylbilane synthase [Pyrinomonadaceae bacterium]